MPDDEKIMRLTSLTGAAGGAAKMGPGTRAQVLQPLQNIFKDHEHPALLVGLNSGDDAAVYKINNDMAVIHTIDFFTPSVDDPFPYGAAAAVANAVSDVYAMGGEIIP